MNKNFAVLFLAVIILISSLIAVQLVTSATSQKIFIKPDGSINPSTSPIRQVGIVYTFTADINSEIVVECNNIAIDGAGYALQGSGSGVAINMTCSNVTVQNIRITNWDAGVLGVFDNNTVKNNVITQCQSAFKIYAKYYVIIRNDIENNNEAIRIGGGGQHFIANNNITKNAVGFSLFDSGNVIVENNINDCSDCAIILDNIAWTQTVYHNNFVNNTKDLTDYTSSHTPERPLQNALLPWDNGSSGNYWSNYPGTDSNHDGVSDTPFEIPTYYSGIVVAPYGYVDRYPLTAPQNINGATPPIPSSLIPASNTYLISSADEQAKALSFLKDVLSLI